MRVLDKNEAESEAMDVTGDAEPAVAQLLPLGAQSNNN